MQTGTHQQLHNAERQITGETYVKRLSGYYEFVYREEKMRADKIKTIIGNINDLPYKTILFDGTWGVVPLRKQTGFLDESMNGMMALIKASRSNVLLLRRLMSQNH